MQGKNKNILDSTQSVDLAHMHGTWAIVPNWTPNYFRKRCSVHSNCEKQIMRLRANDFFLTYVCINPFVHFTSSMRHTLYSQDHQGPNI